MLKGRYSRRQLSGSAIYSTDKGEVLLTLPHQLSSVNLGPRSDNLRLSDSLLGSGRRQALLELDGEVDVLQENRFNRNTPFLSCSFDLRYQLQSLYAHDR